MSTARAGLKWSPGPPRPFALESRQWRKSSRESVTRVQSTPIGTVAIQRLPSDSTNSTDSTVFVSAAFAVNANIVSPSPKKRMPRGEWNTSQPMSGTVERWKQSPSRRKKLPSGARPLCTRCQTRSLKPSERHGGRNPIGARASSASTISRVYQRPSRRNTSLSSIGPPVNTAGPPAWTNASADAATERGMASQDGTTSAA